MKLLLIISNVLSLVVIAVMIHFYIAEGRNVHERLASMAEWAKTVDGRLDEQDGRNKAFASFDTSVTNGVTAQSGWNDITDASIGKLNDRLNTTDQNIKLVHDFATAINRELQIWEKGENDHFLQNLDFAIKVNANINKLSGRVDALEHPAVAP